MVTPTMDDNPCWGGCQSNEHDLEYLLRILGTPLLPPPSSSSTIPSASVSSTSIPPIAAADAAIDVAAASVTSEQSAWSQARIKISEDTVVLANSVENGNDETLGTSNIILSKTNTTTPQPFIFLTTEEHASFFQRIQNKLIIYHDEHYIVLHKPPDLRLDGPYKATVHKLLLYLFPPPSLTSIIGNNNNNHHCCFNLQNASNETTQALTTHIPPSSISTEATILLQQNHNQLLRSIYPLSSHSSLPDDPFRLVHQLDYATSGVLLLGKTRKATAVACKSFEERRTTKKYVAVVTTTNHRYSNISSSSNLPPLGPDFFHNLPILHPSSLNAWRDGSLERHYKKKRQRDTNTVRYLPIHSVFDKWRSTLLRRRNERGVEEENGGGGGAGSGGDAIPFHAQIYHTTDASSTRLPKPLLPTPKVALTSEEEEELLSLGTSWKAVKSNILAMDSHRNNDEGCDNKGATTTNKWIDIVETMAREYNQALGEYYTEQNLQQKKNNGDINNGATGRAAAVVAASTDLALPPMFRISSGGGTDNNNRPIEQESIAKDEDSAGDPNTTFYICASIGEIKGRFHVVVDPSISLPKRDRLMISSSMASSGDADNLPPMRPALTKCTVLSRGYYNSSQNNSIQHRILVAKVLLEPWTGRRHQLRVHLANIAGCPILGDVAYDGSDENNDDDDDDDIMGSTTTTATTTKSTIETSATNHYSKERSRLICRRMCLHAKELTIPLLGGESKTFVAMDPFLLDEETLEIL
jgi:23S rRNA-/tRNA-specific pseudouridylate synthase